MFLNYFFAGVNPVFGLSRVSAEFTLGKKALEKERKQKWPKPKSDQTKKKQKSASDVRAAQIFCVKIITEKKPEIF